MSDLEALVAKASAWSAQDPDPQTRAELEALIAARDEVALADRMNSRLGFGTAGLRGELGAGPNRMNRVLVAQAAAGIAAFIKGSPEFAADPSVVIGFDGRVNSDVFARDSAEIFAAAGIRTILTEMRVPTPVLAFAVKSLGVSAGVMVTASHNPPRDNGYKVYLGGANGGSQIISPTDKQIAAEIEKVAATLTFDQIPKSNEFETIGVKLIDDYVATVASLVSSEPKPELKVVYTAMHGVGWQSFSKAFAAAGFAEPAVVEAQNEPDGMFPTVAFPNPEEPGAMDLSFAKASEVGADIILANDPDADRLAVAVPDCTLGSGWRRLTGDEVGLLLGDAVAEGAVANGKKGVLANSIVSSSVLGAVAKHFSLEHRQTLTGFKWISKVPRLLFGFEEALGYCVDPQRVPDKDGISAALLVANLAARLKSEGKTLDDKIAELSERYGFFATGQISIRVSDLSLIAETMAKLREMPPASLLGQTVEFTDMSLGFDGLPPTDGLRFETAGGLRVIVRPSGTEPKLKCYLQVVAGSAAEAKVLLAQLTAAMRSELGA